MGQKGGGGPRGQLPLNEGTGSGVGGPGVGGQDAVGITLPACLGWPEPGGRFALSGCEAVGWLQTCFCWYVMGVRRGWWKLLKCQVILRGRGTVGLLIWGPHSGRRARRKSRRTDPKCLSLPEPLALPRYQFSSSYPLTRGPQGPLLFPLLQPRPPSGSRADLGGPGSHPQTNYPLSGPLLMWEFPFVLDEGSWLWPGSGPGGPLRVSRAGVQTEV